ncbi:MAG: hypothetical protein HOZ81_22865 [Streptomyces sp.]|nr:hypothetical protein [Streptomyces sp.]
MSARQATPESWVLTLRANAEEGELPVTKEAYELCQRGEMYPECAS